MIANRFSRPSTLVRPSLILPSTITYRRSPGSPSANSTSARPSRTSTIDSSREADASSSRAANRGALRTMSSGTSSPSAMAPGQPALVGKESALPGWPGITGQPSPAGCGGQAPGGVLGVALDQLAGGLVQAPLTLVRQAAQGPDAARKVLQCLRAHRRGPQREGISDVVRELAGPRGHANQPGDLEVAAGGGEPAQPG